MKAQRSLREFALVDHDRMERQEEIAVQQAARNEALRRRQGGEVVDPGVLATHALTNVRTLRAAVRSALESGGTIDPVDALRIYYEQTAFGRWDNVRGNKTTMHNAVVHPEPFAELDSYDQERIELARALWSIGAFDVEYWGGAPDTTLYLDTNTPDGYTSEPRRLVDVSTFRIGRSMPVAEVAAA